MQAQDFGRVLVAGHTGMAGSAIVRRLRLAGQNVLAPPSSRVDFCDQAATFALIEDQKPDTLIVAAAKVGGIEANRTQPQPFLYDNLMIAANLAEAAHRADVRRVLFLGSSCIYPRLAPQPMPESALLTGPLEPTNEWYAIAKIAGIKLMDAYRKSFGHDWISLMPTNLYGPGDNFDPASSHVPAALMLRFHQAMRDGVPEVVVWGSGTPKREFTHVDDLADACLFALGHFHDAGPLNVGWGEDISIRDFALLMADVVGYRGAVVFDAKKPDGMPRKLLDTSKMDALGWRPQIELRAGLTDAYAHFLRTKWAHRLLAA